VAAISALLENNDCDVVFSDDGLQHYRMQRDFEIAVVDSSRRFGNCHCLPAGPMREPESRLSKVDMVVFNGASSSSSEDCFYNLEFASVVRLDGSEQRPLSSFAGREIHAVAGIGHPARFFDQLSQQRLNVVEHAFPDHHRYRQEDFQGWDSEIILMTEKDAVKCRNLSLDNAWMVTVNAVFSDTLEQQLSSLLLPMIGTSD
jgi:tetraacyldisaccharide 4'-kinase